MARLYPPEDVTAGEWRYLLRRFPKDADDRRDRIRMTLKRLHRNGRDPKSVHEALMRAIRARDAHEKHLMTRQEARQRNAAIHRAQKDVERALASLRRLLPPVFHLDVKGPRRRLDWRIGDDVLFQNRDLLLNAAEVPAPERAKGGRPWVWKQVAENGLREARVGASDRRELLAALGFLPDYDKYDKAPE